MDHRKALLKTLMRFPQNPSAHDHKHRMFIQQRNALSRSRTEMFLQKCQSQISSKESLIKLFSVLENCFVTVIGFLVKIYFMNKKSIFSFNHFYSSCNQECWNSNQSAKTCITGCLRMVGKCR